MLKCRGFSIVELVVVIAIIGIALGIGLPGYRSWMEGLQIRNAADSILNGLQQARIEALRRNTTVSFWLVSLTDKSVMDNSCANSNTGSSWVVSVDDPEGQCAIAPSETTTPRIVASHAAGDGNRNVTIAATSSTAAAAYCATFNGYGQLQSACADASSPLSRVVITSSVDTSSAARSLEIRVTTGGSVRMCDPTVSTSGDPRKC